VNENERDTAGKMNINGFVKRVVSSMIDDDSDDDWHCKRRYEKITGIR
jgi:hypothetical protein